MIVSCRECGKRYNVPDEKITPSGLRFKCVKCGQPITARRPSAAGQPRENDLKGNAPAGAQAERNSYTRRVPMPELEALPFIWSPSCICSSAVLFSPAYAAYYLAKNWRTLDQPDRTRSAMTWFYVSLGLLIPLLLVPPVAFIYLLVWYIASGRKQITYVREKYGRKYRRRSFLKTALIPVTLMGTLVVLVTVFIAVPGYMGLKARMAGLQQIEGLQESEQIAKGMLEPDGYLIRLQSAALIEDEADAAFRSASGEGFTSSEALSLTVKLVVIPKMNEYVEALEAIEPRSPEEEKVHAMVLQAVHMKLQGYHEYAAALDNADKEALKKAAQKIQETDTMYLDAMLQLVGAIFGEQAMKFIEQQMPRRTRH